MLAPPAGRLEPQRSSLGLARRDGLVTRSVALAQGNSGPTSDAPASGEAMWRVVHTKSRQEKALAETLEGAGIECFLPLIRRLRTYGHRRRVAQIPLFSCYLFLRGAEEDARFALETGRAVRSLHIPDPLRLERELESIRLALAAGADLAACPALRPGRRVRVARGPLKGVEGVIETTHGRRRLVLEVHALNQSTSLDIDASDVESAE